MARVESSCVLALVAAFLLCLFGALFCFHFSSLLRRGFRPLVPDLVAEENLRTVHFSALNKRVGEHVGARAASLSLSVRVAGINVAAVANACVLRKDVLFHRALGPLRCQ